MSDRKAEIELAVFRQFAVAATILEIDATSIEKRCPPEPDIRCQTRTGVRAMELVELLDEIVARAQGDGRTLQSELTATLESRPVPALRGRLVRVRFRDEAALARKAAAVSEVVRVLENLPAGYLGEIPPPADVTRIELHPWALESPLRPAVYAGGGWIEPVAIGAVDAKCRKSYVTDAPIDLLAYYQRQPVGTDLWSHPDLCERIQQRLSGSPFQRAWVFDTWSGEILFCYPPMTTT
jgi:hypothetical protein